MATAKNENQNAETPVIENGDECKAPFYKRTGFKVAGGVVLGLCLAVGAGAVLAAREAA